MARSVDVRLAVACCLALAATAAGASDGLRITGTGTALGAMRRVAAAYGKASPGGSVQVLPSLGSSGAVKAVADGAIDLALTGRPLKPDERSRAIVALPYARTPFVLAAGPRVGVTGLGTEELVRIYRGDLATWPNGERVRLVLRPRSDIDTALLAGLSPAMASAVDAAFAREGMLVAATNQDCHEILVRTPGSVGPSTLTQIATEDPSLRALAWNGVEPTLENLAAGRYPLEKTLHAVVRRPPSAAVRRFLEFLGSREARAILQEAGNLPVPLPAPD
ncbi:MAG TPA: substrate-binding domain-containing protein [Anaeromyxobacteraceae bacterium]|nr:substrate-binding domain-containing protein [Anaeromyxobacteraceae bacterium]